MTTVAATAPSEPLEAMLRTNLEQVDREILERQERKTELITQVKSEISRLQELLTRYEGNSSAAVTTSSKTADQPTQTKAKPDPTPVIEYVRRVLKAEGKEIATPDLRQRIIDKFHVNPDRLKNLSQILFKAKKSVYKSGGKVGLVEWQHKRQPSKAAGKQTAKKALKKAS